MKKLFTTAFAFLLLAGKLWAQPAFQVTDQQPAMVNGLQLGYTIKSQETKAVSDKGDFSRYSVKFYITNTTDEAKIMLYRDGWNSGNSSDQVVQFNCLNATGARLTSKSVTLSAPVCSILAMVEDKDGAGRSVKNKRYVQIGYWIQAGQTITADVILITPLNELPNVQAIYLGNKVQQTGSASLAGPVNSGYVAQNNNMPPPPMLINSNGYLRLKNVSNGTYMNTQVDPITSTTIKDGWWSAQWQLIPIPGSKYITIKNRWKSSFISVDRGFIAMIGNGNAPGSMWEFEPSRDPNVFRIKNGQTGVYLCLAQNGQLVISHDVRNNFTTAWQLEQP